MDMVEMDYFSIKRRRGSIDEDEERKLEEYFNTSYVPLSNLPTPPLSSTSSPMMKLKSSTSDGLSSAPSMFLCKLVPQHHPNTDHVASYIARAELTDSTVALAACILDSLSSSFIRSWRRACEKARSPETTSFHSNPLKPELMVLGALAIAHNYLHDVAGEPKWWALVAKGAVEPREVTATTRCILQDIDYGLMSFTPEDVEAMRQEIYRKEDEGVRGGRAVFSQGQLTPDISPS